MRCLTSNLNSEISHLKSQISSGCSVCRPTRHSSFVFRLSSFRRGFSLVEVLLAIFILGIGMIMVASVFPVGADWTRQTAEESVGQTVAQDALAVIRAHYGPAGDLALLRYVAPDFHVAGNHNWILQNSPSSGSGPFAIQALPGFISDSNTNSPGIPPAERAYQFGSINPFPATRWQNCTYFWTALARLSPMHRNPAALVGDPDNGILVSSTYNYDVYILVFRKGAVEHTFSNPSSAWPSGFVEVPSTRDPNWGAGVTLVPSVIGGNWSAGLYNASQSPSVYNAIPPLGQYGIGAWSGTVFKQVLNPVTYTSAAPRPFLFGQNTINANPPQEPIIYAPAADGSDNSASPLIYVYQTTLTF